MYSSIKLILLLFISLSFQAQTSEINIRLEVGELDMTFPSIYFKHNSTEYANMPYSVDSCFKHIAMHIKDVTGKPIWRDSLEAEKLSIERIKKIRTDLSKYTTKKLAIQSMKTEQKISRRTINSGLDSAQVNYLLSLNSVFDIAKTRSPKTTQSSHGLWILGTCFKCIIGDIFRNGSSLGKSGREHCRMDRRHMQKNNYN